MAETANSSANAIPWRLIFRVVRWTTYAGAVVTLALLLHKTPPPVVETNALAAARVEQKLEQVEQAVSNGQPGTMRMDQTELNSYLASHLDIASNPAAAQAHSVPSGSSQEAATAIANAAAGNAPPGTSAEQLEQVRSTVKDVKVELIDDRVRAYVVFDLHGKDVTLQLEGKLGAEDGYLRFEPAAGQIGSLPIPQSALETAVRRMMESPENREKLKLPPEISSLKIENGEVVVSYK